MHKHILRQSEAAWPDSRRGAIARGLARLTLTRQLSENRIMRQAPARRGERRLDELAIGGTTDDCASTASPSSTTRLEVPSEAP